MLAPGGELAVIGWIVAAQPVVAVHLLSAGHVLGAAITGLPRADVARAYPLFRDAGRAGFRFAGMVDDAVLATERLTVRALAVDGSAHEVFVPMPVSDPAPAAHTDERQRIHLHIEETTLSEAGTLAVGGWVVCAVGLGPLTIALDGVELGAARLGLEREDVGRRFPDVPLARLAGFRFVREGVAVGPRSRELRVVARNGLDQRAEVAPELRIIAATPPTCRPDEFRLELDTPRVTDGVVLEPVSTRLSIGGWALARSGVDRVHVSIDGRAAGEAHYGSPRPDVAAVLPAWPDVVRSGYTFGCPPRLLTEGTHEAAVTLVARNGDEHTRCFSFTVRRPSGAEQPFGIRRRVPRAEQDLQLDLLRRLGWQPDFWLLLAVRDVGDVPAIATTIESLRTQCYRAWRLLLVVADEACAAGARQALGQADAGAAGRVEIIAPGSRLDRGFDLSNQATMVGSIGPGDELGADALLEMAVASGLDRAADFFYCDEARVGPTSGENAPFFKPGWSPHLLLSTNYIGRFWCARPKLLRWAEITPHRLLVDGDYDVVLRCTENARAIHHLVRLLCQRGGSDEAEESECAALTAAVARRAIPAAVTAGRVPGSYRLRRPDPVEGLVSVIIPTCAASGHVRNCIDSLQASTTVGQIEIICIENIPTAEAHWKEWLADNVDRVISTEETFNWARFNNLCAREASGEFLLFLNDDTEITRLDWLEAMLEVAALPGVGVVGPQLLYPDGRVQHAGMFLARAGLARHAFRMADADDPAYFGLALTTRNVIAVTGACLLVRRALFESLGGFDEAHEIINNDLDFCLRVHQAGHAVVYTPHASLVHHEMASRGALPDDFDIGRFEARWRDVFLQGDPFFSPHLSRNLDDYAPEAEPTQLVVSGHPRFAREEIGRILVVKLDHIGDFFTALPAIRRLRGLFPEARLTLLGNRGMDELVLGTGLVDAFIAFEFFHLRSSLGSRELAAQDLADLRARLTPLRFDLAIDLRKHPDTREILRESGARYLVGFDHLGQYPWLDVALEWEGDQGMHAKRGHIADDLLNLVEAVATATQPERAALRRPATPSGRWLRFLSRRARRLFDLPVVCVHPGVGNVMRQWPVEQFIRLIDMLVAELGVGVVVIGGADEQALGEAIVAQVRAPEAVVSLVGDVPLAQLPALFGACALFVGNNSGPQHVAAACGVPTVGVHSGVVDATEWAPIGLRAVAVRRSMACSPCYLARIEDCHRDLACLRELEPASVFAVCERLLAGIGAPDVSSTSPC